MNCQIKFLLTVLLIVVASTGQARGQQEDQLVPRIVNGLFTSEFPSTGALLFGTGPDVASSWCSGTLVGCETFLTAAHCVCDTIGANCQGANAPDPGSYAVYFQHAGIFLVESIRVRGDFNFPVGDVAIVKLATPVNGIAPSKINTIQAPEFGTHGTIVGFGRSGGSNFDYGLKRFGDVETSSCPFGVSNTTSVCWTFEDPIGPPGTDSSTCNADSGGPLFIDFGEGEVVAGITSGGTGSNCFPEDQAFDADVFFYREWIQNASGPDIENTACGSLPQVGGVNTNVLSFQGSLSDTNPEQRSSFVVSEGTTMLRVAMNAEDDGSQDFNLFVNYDTPPTVIEADCARDGSNQFASCEFDTPSQGEWHILIQRHAGIGAYQVTVTTFGESGAGVLSVDLDSSINNISPGDQFDFTLSILNQTDAGQTFGVSVGLLGPGISNPIELISPVPLALGKDESHIIMPTITLPGTAPPGTYSIGANIFDLLTGSTIDNDVITFDVN